MKMNRKLWLGLLLAVCIPALGQDAPRVEAGFEPLFNGKDLTGWTGSKYVAENALLVCPADGGGTMLTEKEYSDFIFRFDFKLEPAGNNGVAIRCPLEGDPAYAGMEIQILDDSAPDYKDLRPAQYHGSIYDVVPAKRGAENPPGEWNSEEILCAGPIVKVTLNGQVIVDADLSTITDPAVLEKHPGLNRPSGHIGFAGHGCRIEFRNLRILDLMKLGQPK